MNDQIPASGRSLVGVAIPAVRLTATTGRVVDLADGSLGDFVLFIYPRTGHPDRPDTAEWQLIPGAKGCTVESCEFRDLAAEFALIGFSIYGLSTQESADQQEAIERLHLPYPLLSDPQRHLGRALGLPTFGFAGSELYKRSTLVVRSGMIVMAHLEITEAASHPRDLLASLSGRRS